MILGRTSTKLDEVKAKYLKSEIKVHNVHNVYVISLCELNVYQQNYLSVTLPALLDLQQKLQEGFAKQWLVFFLIHLNSDLDLLCSNPGHKCHLMAYILI